MLMFRIILIFYFLTIWLYYGDKSKRKGLPQIEIKQLILVDLLFQAKTIAVVEHNGSY